MHDSNRKSEKYKLLLMFIIEHLYTLKSKISSLLHKIKSQVYNDFACAAGGQSVSEPGSRGFTGADGVAARLWLRYPAVFLDTTGLLW